MMGDRGLSNVYLENLVTKKLALPNFAGVYSSDSIPRGVLNSQRASCICNTRRRNETGEHFVAVLVTTDCIYVMDSLARKLVQASPPLHDRLHSTGKRVSCVFDAPMQSPNTLYCGYYAVCFLCYLNIGHFESDRLRGKLRPIVYDAFRTNDKNVVHNVKCFIRAVRK